MSFSVFRVFKIRAAALLAAPLLLMLCSVTATNLKLQSPTQKRLSLKLKNVTWWCPSTKAARLGFKAISSLKTPKPLPQPLKKKPSKL